MSGSKLWPGNKPHLLPTAGCIQVCIPNKGRDDLNVIKGCDEKCKSNTVTTHCTGVCDTCRGFCQMSSSHERCLLRQVQSSLERQRITICLVVPVRVWGHRRIQSNHNFLELLLNRSPPEVSPWFLINLHRFLHGVGQLDTLHVACLPVAILTFAMIQIRVRNGSETHHLNAGSSWIWFATAYSASCIGLESFKCINSNQSKEKSRHWQSNFHPFVVVLGIFCPPCVVV